MEGVPDGLLTGEAGWVLTELRKACEPGGNGQPARTWASLVARKLIELNDRFYYPADAPGHYLPFVTLTTLGREVAGILQASISKSGRP